MIATRSVTPPPTWTRDRRHLPAVVVRREEDVRPDPAVLARFREFFPRRTVVWNAAHQWFEVLERRRDGEGEQHVCFLTVEVADEDGYRVPHFRPFDYSVVLEHARERFLAEARGFEFILSEVDRRNRQRERSWVRHHAGEATAALAEGRRYLPVLWGEAPVPQVAVTTSLKE